MSHWHPGYVYAIYGRYEQNGDRVKITDWQRDRDALAHRMAQMKADDYAEGIYWGDYEIKMISADWLA